MTPQRSGSEGLSQGVERAPGGFLAARKISRCFSNPSATCRSGRGMRHIHDLLPQDYLAYFHCDSAQDVTLHECVARQSRQVGNTPDNPAAADLNMPPSRPLPAGADGLEKQRENFRAAQKSSGARSNALRKSPRIRTLRRHSLCMQLVDPLLPKPRRCSLPGWLLNGAVASAIIC